MLQLISTSFLATLMALLKIAIIIVVAAWMVRGGIFTQDHIRALSGVLVNLALPCLIFASLVSHFHTAGLAHWWKFPLMGAALTFVPFLLAFLVFSREKEARGTLSALAAFQNAGYLVLPIGEVLFPDQFGRFSVYLFLMLLTYNPLLWSMGSFLISHRPGSGVRLRTLITTPFCATVVALLLVFTGLDSFLPGLLMGSVDLVGQSCVPLATLVLGMTMGSLRVRRMPSAWRVSRVVALKLMVIPLLMFLLLRFSSLSSGPLESAYWILEASSPPATALVIQVIHFGGDEEMVCGILVVCYLAALVTIPLFYSLVHVLL